MTIAGDIAGFEARRIATNGINLHVVVGGTGPLIVLLHGWPEHWATWRHIMRPLRDAGYTVAAPDLRGFNLSDKPSRVSDYQLDHVSRDVMGLVHALGFEKAHIVGHDWGGSTAWNLVMHFEDVVDRCLIANAPHPKLFSNRLRSLEQLRASYYMFLFQLPGVSEKRVARDDFKVIRSVLKYQPCRRDAFDSEDAEAYVAALKQPGALTASLNYYRAGFRARRHMIRPPTNPNGAINVPLRILWGMKDAALPPGNLDRLETVAKNIDIVRIPDCSHWVQHDAPEVVIREALDFFGKPADRK